MLTVEVAELAAKLQKAQLEAQASHLERDQFAAQVRAAEERCLELDDRCAALADRASEDESAENAVQEELVALRRRWKNFVRNRSAI